MLFYLSFFLFIKLIYSNELFLNTTKIFDETNFSNREKRNIIVINQILVDIDCNNLNNNKLWIIHFETDIIEAKRLHYTNHKSGISIWSGYDNYKNITITWNNKNKCNYEQFNLKIIDNNPKFFKLNYINEWESLYNTKMNEIMMEHHYTKIIQELAPLVTINNINNRSLLIDKNKSKIIINLGVFWTESVHNKLGNLNRVKSIITMNYESINHILKENNINLVINLKFIHKVSYSESHSNMEIDLANFLKGKRGLEYTHKIREKYKLDIMQLVINNPSSCGYGYILTEDSKLNWRDNAISVVHYQCFNYFSHLHEIGHNLGLNHDRTNTNIKGFGDYGYGYKNCVDNYKNRFRTIMSYDCENMIVPRIPYFSSPYIFYNGIPTGTIKNNNRRVINKTKNLVSNFR